MSFTVKHLSSGKKTSHILLPKQPQAVVLKRSTHFDSHLKFGEEKAEKWREGNKHL